MPPDDAEAVRWLQLAVAQDEPRAQYNLGVFYETGVGVTPDFAEARRLYELAAAQGHESSIARLAELDAAAGKPGK